MDGWVVVRGSQLGGGPQIGAQLVQVCTGGLRVPTEAWKAATHAQMAALGKRGNSRDTETELHTHCGGGREILFHASWGVDFMYGGGQCRTIHVNTVRRVRGCRQDGQRMDAVCTQTQTELVVAVRFIHIVCWTTKEPTRGEWVVCSGGSVSRPRSGTGECVCVCVYVLGVYGDDENFLCRSATLRLKRRGLAASYQVSLRKEARSSWITCCRKARMSWERQRA